MTPPPNPFSQVAGELLEKRLRAVVDALAAAAKFDPCDPEPVHRLRVASRRAVAALDFFKPLLPTSIRELRAMVRRVRRAADVARDNDVLAGRLTSNGKTESVARTLDRCDVARRSAQAPIVREHDALTHDRRIEDCVATVCRAVEAPCADGLSADVAARRWIAGRIRRMVRRFRKASRPRRWTIDRLHAFRIAGKKLRYALELAAALESSTVVRRPGQDAASHTSGPKVSRRAARLETALDFLERLQDQLGGLNDFASGARLLGEWETKADDADERREIRALRREERQSFRRDSRRFARWWTATRRRRAIERFQRLSR